MEKKDDYEVGYGKPPKNRQFGQPEGNPMNRGWKKEDTPRYKLERMLSLSDDELKEIVEDPASSRFDQVVALTLHEGDWQKVERMIDQVYGKPKQQVEQVVIEPPKPLSPRKKHPELEQ